MNRRSSITRNIALGFALQVAVLAVVMVLGLSQLREIQLHHRRAEQKSSALAAATDVLATVRGAAVENSFYVSTGDGSRVLVRDSLLAAGRRGITALEAEADTPRERDAWAEAARGLDAWRPLLAGVADATALGRAEVARRIREQALPARLRIEAAMREGVAIERAQEAAALADRDTAGRMAYVIFLGGGLLAFLGAALTGIRFTRQIRGQMAERQEARVALERSEARFREIADHITQVYFVVEPSGQCVYVSPAFAVLTGRPVEAAYVAPWSWTDGIHPEDLPGLRRAMIKADGDARGHAHEFRVIRPDGGQRWVRQRAWTVRDESERPVRMVGYAEDITELHETERRLIQAQKMEAVGRLAGGVAHDFNNVLTVIQGYAEMLREDLESEEARADLTEITGAVGRAKALTRQLLAFSRQQVLQPVVLDPEKVIAGTEKMLRRLIGEDVDLVFDLHAADNRVRVDGGQLEQVLLNLAVNARDAMPRGGQLTIATARERFDADGAAAHDLPGPGKYLAIAVSDTGTGMTPDVRDRVFEPFFTTKDPGQGTGLGLATVFGIVKQSGGHVTVYSEFGKGSTFRIYLPVVAPAPDEATAEPAEIRPAAAARRGGTVLLAEDDPDVRGVATGLLRREGFTVLPAENGAEALALATEHGDAIDLVITDVVMPVMDGPTLVTRLREGRPGIRSLFTSGYAGEAIVRRGVLESGVAFLEKPYTSAGLLRKVREVLEA